MKFDLYSVRDCVADEFGPIFQCKNDAVACRMFGSMFTVSESKDLELYNVGSFDTEKGVKAGKPKEVDTTNVVFAPDSPRFGERISPKEKLDIVTEGLNDEKSTLVK